MQEKMPRKKETSLCKLAKRNPEKKIMRKILQDHVMAEKKETVPW